MESKGVEVRRDRNRGTGGEKHNTRREVKSLRIGVHHANAKEPAHITHLDLARGEVARDVENLHGRPRREHLRVVHALEARGRGERRARRERDGGGGERGDARGREP
eukprot:30440-Pelagococcus_subviridis.AAC.1